MLTRSIDVTTNPMDPAQYLLKMRGGKSRNLMSSGGNEPVADGGAPGHSVFANAFLQGLTGIDENEFTAMDFFTTYVQRRVVGSSDQIPQYVPIRDSGDVEGDFVFVRASGASNVSRPGIPSTLGNADASGRDKLPSSTQPTEGSQGKATQSAAIRDLSAARQRAASGTASAAPPLFQKAAAEGSAAAMSILGEYYDSASPILSVSLKTIRRRRVGIASPRMPEMQTV